MIIQRRAYNLFKFLMFNKKKKMFSGLLVMSFVLVFTSACQKAEVYDIEPITGDQSIEEPVFIDEEGIDEEGAEEGIEEDVENDAEIVEEGIDEEVNIIFEDLEWKNYNNKLLSYSLQYPTIVNVMGDDLDQHIEFVGPLSNNEWWPRVSVSHYSSDFYRPGEGVELSTWVKPFPGYELGDEISIAGLETLHYIQVKTPQAWGADYYYFIKDNQLYNITITHGNDKQDWDLYNKILNSFIFIDTEEAEDVDE